MDDVRAILDGVVRLYRELDEKTSHNGGLGNILGMHRRLREALAMINAADLHVVLREIDRAKQSLDRLKADIAEIETLKAAFESGGVSRAS